MKSMLSFFALTTEISTKKVSLEYPLSVFNKNSTLKREDRVSCNSDDHTEAAHTKQHTHTHTFTHTGSHTLGHRADVDTNIDTIDRVGAGQVFVEL